MDTTATFGRVGRRIINYTSRGVWYFFLPLQRTGMFASIGGRGGLADLGRGSPLPWHASTWRRSPTPTPHRPLSLLDKLRGAPPLGPLLNSYNFSKTSQIQLLAWLLAPPGAGKPFGSAVASPSTTVRWQPSWWDCRPVRSQLGPAGSSPLRERGPGRRDAAPGSGEVHGYQWLPGELLLFMVTLLLADGGTSGAEDGIRREKGWDGRICRRRRGSSRRPGGAALAVQLVAAGSFKRENEERVSERFGQSPRGVRAPVRGGRTVFLGGGIFIVNRWNSRFF